MDNFRNENLMVDLSKIGKFNKKEGKILIKKRKKELLINNFLELDKDFLRVLYLIVGDGCVKDEVMMANINYRIHLDFIKNLNKYFNVNKEDLYFTITTNKNFDNFKNLLSEKFWLNSLNINKINHKYKTKFNTCDQGGLKTSYNSKELSDLFKILIKNVNQLIYNKSLDSKSLCAVLDGILNAEGSAEIVKSNLGLHKVTISFNKHDSEEKKLFSSILENLDLINLFKIDQERKYVVRKWFNLYSFIKTFVLNNAKPFSLSPYKLINLCYGFLNHQRTKSIQKYLLIINKKQNQTFNEINYYLKHHTTSIEEALIRKFRGFGFFRLEGLGKNRNPYRVSITEEGLIFLKVINKLETWLQEAKQDFAEDIKIIKEVMMEEEKLPFEKIKREIFIKKESETNWNYGMRPDERAVNNLINYGVVNINKPSGPR